MSGLDSTRSKPPIFISYSAEEGPALETLERLCRALEPHFDVLVDRERLKPDYKWREELHIWMKLCRAAVVLLSKEAVSESHWVKREATILGFRREDDPNFKLISVLFPGVTPQLLQQSGFEPVALEAFQAVRGDTPEKVVAEVSAAIAPIRESSERTPLERFEDRLAVILYDELEGGGKDPQPLIDAAELLGAPLLWRADMPYSKQLARRLLEAGLEKAPPVFGHLAQYFRDEDRLKHLLDLLKPFWVSPDAAMALSRMGRRPRGRRAVCVNGVEHPFTAECYIRRACVGQRRWVMADIIPKKGYEEVRASQLQSIEATINKTVAFELGLDPGEEDEEYVASELEARERTGEPYFILVPKDFDEELLARLRERFESYTFFMLHGNREPDERDLEGRHIVLLKPTLTQGRDVELRRLYRIAKGEIRRAN